MNVPFESINWLAVIVAGLATFFLGGLWYTALFGKVWLRLHNFTEAQFAAMKKDKPPALFFTVMIVAYLLIATVFAALAGAANVGSWVDGILLGALLWLGFALAIGLTSYMASDRPLGVFVIDVSYQLLYLLMMGAIIGGWQ